MYKVRRKKDNEVYALKRVDLERRKENEKLNAVCEAIILATIRSPYITSYREAFFENINTFCLVTELADNCDLSYKITKVKNRHTFFKETEIWKVFI